MEKKQTSWHRSWDSISKALNLDSQNAEIDSQNYALLHYNYNAEDQETVAQIDLFFLATVSDLATKSLIVHQLTSLTWVGKMIRDFATKMCLVVSWNTKKI